MSGLGFSLPRPPAFPTQRKMASSALAKAKSTMIRKVIATEFLVPTLLAVALVMIVLSIGAIYLTDKYLGPIEQGKLISPWPATVDLLKC